MRIFDIINKLENIKHNYLIYALEKYTNQITSEDIKKKEEERKKQEEVAKEEIKKPVDEVKKPVEEVKKPAEEVKKFETNIMDSLKWVFISIGIFIFIIVGLSLIYWFMFSDNNNEQNIIAVPANQYVTPPVNQYVTPPVNQYATPPVNQYATPKNIDNTKDNEESIFSLFSRSDKQPEIISKTKVPTEADIILDVKPTYETHLISKAHTDAEAYLEKRAETDINKLNQDNNISKLILSPAKEDNNINEYKKEVPKV